MTLPGPDSKAAKAWMALVGPRIFVCSIPKCGTNLLLSALRAVPGLREHPDPVDPKLEPQVRVQRLLSAQRGRVQQGHLPWAPDLGRAARQRGIRTFLLIRDPRGYVVSLAHYIVKRADSHRFGRYFSESLPDLPSRIRACIVGVPGHLASDGRPLPSVADRYGAFLPWRNEPGVLVCRFEDLIGPSGGGDATAQRRTYAAVLEHLGMGGREPLLKAVIQRAYNAKSPTFRAGQIGDWKQHFDAGTRAEFEANAGGLLSQLGYETGWE